MDDTKLDLSRRDLLLSALVLAACGKALPPGLDGGIDAGVPLPDAGSPRDVPFGVWEEVRAALRGSPDHLAQEAERLVSAGDPVRLYEFVRDRFVTLPANPTTLGGTTDRLWGLRGTLRSGTGTMRDKADLLVDLFTRAGFAAEVVRVPTPADPGFVAKALVRTVEHVFSPAADTEQVARWLQRLGLSPARLAPIDGARVEGDALAATLLAALPADPLGVQAFSFVSPTSIPVVRVTVGGLVKLCNPVVPDLAFGDPGTPGSPQTAGPAAALPRVRATVSVVTSAEPNTPIDVVTGTFESNDVVGRSLHVAFVPPEGLEVAFSRRLDELTTFIPALSLQAPGLGRDVIEANTVVGSAVTRGGDVFVTRADGSLSLNGSVIDTSTYEPSRAAAVATVELRVGAAAFPRVSLRLAVLDGAGVSVQGLPAQAFRVTEEGAERVFTLLENRSPPPRVLFLLDKSTSLPLQFQGAAASTLVKNMATAVVAAFPGATFRIHTVGGNPRDGSWVADPVVLEAAATAQGGFGSDLWVAMGEGAKLGATTVVFLTDGVATDLPDAEKLASLSIAPPSVFLLAGGGSSATLDQMAGLTQGTVFPVNDAAGAQAQTNTFIAARQKSAYLLRYEAPSEGPATRVVSVSLRDGAAAVTGSYEVPASRQRPNRVGGLLLTLQVGSASPVTRVLAGAAELSSTTEEAVFGEAHDAFLGAFEVRFEGASPTLGVVLDELLTARLAMEPLWTAGRTGDRAAIAAAFLATPPMPSGAGLGVHGAPRATGGSAVFPTGLRASIHVAQPVGTRRITRRVDLLPLGSYAALEADRRAALVEALTATTRHALIEAQLYPTSTRSLLRGAPLVHVPPFTSVESVVSGMSVEMRNRWRLAMRGYANGHRLVPASGSPVAFWHLAPGTGALLGVLERGTGGAEAAEAYERDMNQVIDLATRLGALAGLLGVMGAAGGVWLSLELTKAKKLLGAITVLSGGNSMNDPTNWNDAACGVAQAAASAAAGAAGGLLGGAGMLIDAADGTVTVVTGGGLVC